MTRPDTTGPRTTAWDLLGGGAGPAGASAAIGALRADPTLRVALLDRARFPRDKSCGDGIAPHVLDLLADAGVHGLVDGFTAVPRIRLDRGGLTVDRAMRRPTWVVPRAVFDDRLLHAARDAGAHLLTHRARRVVGGSVDGRHTGRVLVGADGAQSVVRRSLGVPRGPRAVAIRGYAPTPRSRAGAQVIGFGAGPQPAYAWSFDRGDGLSNVGYGELLTDARPHPTRTQLVERLEELLPGSTAGAGSWLGHHLPLSRGRTPTTSGPVLLAGDAAGLINPMTGEGIFYAVATGLAAGRAAAEALAAKDPASAGARQARVSRRLLGAHLRHIALAARLCDRAVVLDAGLRASAADRRVFDDLVELGLANGRLTAPLLRSLTTELLRTALRRDPAPRDRAEETRP